MGLLKSNPRPPTFSEKRNVPFSYFHGFVEPVVVTSEKPSKKTLHLTGRAVTVPQNSRFSSPAPLGELWRSETGEVFAFDPTTGQFVPRTDAPPAPVPATRLTAPLI